MKCKIDGLLCFNYNNPKAVKKCANRKRYLRGEPVGGSETSDLGYPGHPKVFSGDEKSEV